MRKAILPAREIAVLREKLNDLIEQKSETIPDATERRRGYCHAAEMFLRQTGYYRGFVYLPDAGAEYDPDGTARKVVRPYRRRYL